MRKFGAGRVRGVALLLTAVFVVGACNPLTYAPGTPRPSWCDPTDTAVNDGHTAAFFAAYTTAKGPLSQYNCQMVVTFLNTARDYVVQYPTVGDAKAAGYVQATVWTPGQGIHFVDESRLDGPFDPQRPNWLVYNGTANSASLVAMMFLVDSGSSSPPAGFPGANDHWHNHGELCYKAGSYPFIVAEGVSDSFCTALGGVNTDFSTQWMVHAWVPSYAGWDATDIFNVDHPSLN